MKKYNYITIFITIIMLLNFTTKINANDTYGWNIERNIELMGNNDYKYIWLDEGVYKYAKENLDDLIIMDDWGKAVPYVLENLTTEVENSVEPFNLNLIDTKKMKDNDFFDYEVKRNDINKDVTINYMELNTSGQDYIKEVNIYGSYDGLLWDYITKDKIYNIENINKNSIYFNDVKKYNFYRFEVPNNVESIKINSITGYKNDSNLYTNEYYKQKESTYTIENKDNSTYIHINNQDRLHIHKIKIETDDIFRRNYGVLLNDREYPDYSGEIYNLDFKSIKAKNTEIDLPNEINDKDILIKINNGDDTQINIKKIDIIYSIDKAIFKKETNLSTYKLIYGNKNAIKPTYDIEKYKTYLAGEGMDECVLGKVIIKESPPVEAEKDNTTMYKMIFDILMLTISIVLVGYIWVKIRKR